MSVVRIRHLSLDAAGAMSDVPTHRAVDPHALASVHPVSVNRHGRQFASEEDCDHPPGMLGCGGGAGIEV